MFRKIFECLLVGTLGACSVYGMATDDRGSGFLSSCHNLMVSWNTQLTPVTSGNGITVNEQQEYAEKWDALYKKLCGGICSGCVFDRTQDKTTEVERVLHNKQSELLDLKKEVNEFLAGVGKKLQEQRAVRNGERIKWANVKKEIEDIDRMLGVLEALTASVGNNIIYNIASRLFNRAYDAGPLDGSNRLQAWFVFYNRVDHHFSQHLISRMHAEALALGSSMQSTAQLSQEIQNRVAVWETKFIAMESLKIPKKKFYGFPYSKDEILLSFLDGVRDSYKEHIVRQWKASFANQQRERCRFFIPNVDEYSIEDFVANSGVAYYKKNIMTLLECEDIPALEAMLWGYPLESEATPKGILLSTLLAETNDGNSYLNNTLIMTNMDELVNVSSGKERHVEVIWNFLKFVTDYDISEGEYRFPYLGAADRTQMRRRIDLSELNVILLAQEKNLKEIEAGVKRLGINPNLVRALNTRFSLIAEKGERRAEKGERIVEE